MPDAPHAPAQDTPAPRPRPARPLPPVEQLHPGLWSIPVPIPNNPLAYVLVYALESDRGPYLIDAGWNEDESYRALANGLQRLGSSVAEVQGVLVTHIHPDHFGLAGRIQEESGAWIGMHPADAEMVDERYLSPGPLLEEVGKTLRSAGAPFSDRESLQQASMPVLEFVLPTMPDVMLEDGDTPDVKGWNVAAVWTPGHTPGHLCFYERDRRLLLSGDHVLPRITPNVSLLDQVDSDPLGDFLDSLRKVAALDVDEVLPAHEHRFVGLDARAQELIEHHEHRLTEVVAALEGGATTAWEVAGQMGWSRPWDRISGFMRRMALLEALAHLRALERRAVVAFERGEPSRWSLARD